VCCLAAYGPREAHTTVKASRYLTVDNFALGAGVAGSTDTLHKRAGGATGQAGITVARVGLAAVVLALATVPATFTRTRCFVFFHHTLAAI